MSGLKNIDGLTSPGFVNKGYLYIQSQALGEGSLLRRICLLGMEPFKNFIYHPGYREVEELLWELPEGWEKKIGQRHLGIP